MVITVYVVTGNVVVAGSDALFGGACFIVAVADWGLDGFSDVLPRYVVIFEGLTATELEVPVLDAMSADGDDCAKDLGLWRAEADKLVDVEPDVSRDDELASQLRLYSGTLLSVVPTRPKLGLGAVGKASCTKKYKVARVSMCHSDSHDVLRDYVIIKPILRGFRGV